MGVIKRSDYQFFKLYKYYTGYFDPRFVPDTIHHTKVDLFFSNDIESKTLDDKNLYDLLFPDACQPKTVIRKVGGVFLDEKYRTLSAEEAFERCYRQERIIIKKSVNSNSGSSINVWSRDKNSESELKTILSSNYDFIVQEFIRQHSTLSQLNQSSLNTLRIMTLFLNGEVIFLSSILRVGSKGSCVDNFHAGGIVIKKSPITCTIH